MGRTLLCSLAGAAAGFLLSTVVVVIGMAAAGARQTATDIGPIIAIMGIILAGMGAIAGAIIGGVADLREFFKKKDQASKITQDRDK